MLRLIKRLIARIIGIFRKPEPAPRRPAMAGRYVPPQEGA